MYFIGCGFGDAATGLLALLRRCGLVGFAGFFAMISLWLRGRFRLDTKKARELWQIAINRGLGGSLAGWSNCN
jgi:predicted alpha/beta hydrolase